MGADEPIIVRPTPREIPMTAEQFWRLEDLAEAIAGPGVSPSAVQVANVLLAWALDELSPGTVQRIAAELKSTK